MNFPGFTAENVLTEYDTHTRATKRTAVAARSFGSEISSIVRPAFVFPPPCALICRLCIKAGGDCIHLGGGRCLCE